MNDTIRQIRTLLLQLETDYAPAEQELVNFEYAYRLCVAFARYIAESYDLDWEDLGDSTRSIYLHRARKLAGIDHDRFLLHIRDGSYAMDDIYDGEAPSMTVEPLELWVALDSTNVRFRGLWFSDTAAKKYLENLHSLGYEWEMVDEECCWYGRAGYSDTATVEKVKVLK